MTITSTPHLLRPLACDGCDCLCDRQVISALIDHGLIDPPTIDRPTKLPSDFPEPDAQPGEDSVHLLTRGCPDPAGRHRGAVWKEKTVRLYILPRYAEVLEARRQAKEAKAKEAEHGVDRRP